MNNLLDKSMREFDLSDLIISTDNALLNKETIFQFLASSYWAFDRPREVILNSINNSLCFGIYISGKQIGFARVVTDYAVFAYLADVFVVKEYQGRGAGKKLLSFILNFPELRQVKKWMLATKDAHSLYSKFGFTEIKDPSKYMEYTPPLNKLKF